MTITELIDALHAALAAHGDLTVVLEDLDLGCFPVLEGCRVVPLATSSTSLYHVPGEDDVTEPVLVLLQ